MIGWPLIAVGVDALFVTDRLADAPTVVVAVALLSAPFGSVVALVAVAVSDSVPGTNDGLIATVSENAAAPGGATFNLTVTVDNGLPPTMIVDTAQVTTTTGDPAPGNEAATATTSTPVSLQSFEID